MKNTKVDISKRKALLGATATAVVAGVWHKPIVNAVVLPAHAQTSMPLPNSFFSPGTQQITNNKDGNFSPLDLFFSNAYAGDDGVPPAPEEFGLLATKVTEETYDILLLGRDLDVIRSGTLNVDGTLVDLSRIAMGNCTDAGAGDRDIPASILSVDQTEIVVQLTSGPSTGMQMIDVTAGVGSGSLDCVDVFNGNGNGNGNGEGISIEGNGVAVSGNL